MNTNSRRRITVVLHDKPQSQRLLELGSRIASQLQAELEAVFVEDAALFRLTGLPFLRELKRDSITEERLDAQRLLKEWRAMAKLARQSLEDSARQAGVSWSFRVWRGEVDQELQQLSVESPMLLLGRLNTLTSSRHLPGYDVSSSRQRPLKLGVILDNAESSEHLLQAVGDMSLKPEIQLILFASPQDQWASGLNLGKRLDEIDPQHHNILVELTDDSPTTLSTSLKAAACDLLMVSEHSELLRGRNMLMKLRALPYPVVVVRQTH